MSQKKLPNSEKYSIFASKNTLITTAVKQKDHLFRRGVIGGLVLALLLVSVSQKSMAQDNKPSIDFFSGIDVGITDYTFYRQYNVLFGLTPGFKFDMGHHWLLSAKGNVWLVNNYNNNLKRAYLTMFVLSKELKAGPIYLKGSVGLFSNARYGFDLKAFLPVTQWLAFEAQAGITGLLTMAGGWSMSPIGRFSGTIGGDIYIPKWNTQFRGVIGSYVFQDWGFEGEVMRHFNHTTLGLYLKWNNIAGQLNQEGITLVQSLKKGMDGGFRVTIMIPPYKRTHRTVNFRTASNYNLICLIRGLNIYRDANQLYRTDTEENMRDGWFSRDLLQWGSHTMEPDFIYQGKEDKE